MGDWSRNLDDEYREDYTIVNDDLFAIAKSIRKATPLDDVKAEIDEQYDRVHPYNIDAAQGLEMALEIIDKYKTESVR